MIEITIIVVMISINVMRKSQSCITACPLLAMFVLADSRTTYHNSLTIGLLKHKDATKYKNHIHEWVPTDNTSTVEQSIRSDYIRNELKKNCFVSWIWRGRTFRQSVWRILFHIMCVHCETKCKMTRGRGDMNTEKLSHKTVISLSDMCVPV